MLACTTVFSVWVYRGTGRLDLVTIASLLGMTAACAVWGRAVFRWTGLDQEHTPSFPVCFTLGLTLLGIALPAVNFFLSITCLWFVSAFLIGAAVIYGIYRGRRLADNVKAGTDSVAALAVAVSLLAATLWAYPQAFPPTFEFRGETVYKPTYDYFVWANLIYLLSSDETAAQLGRFYAAGEPLPFYHYGGFGFTCAIHALARPEAWLLMSALWHPLGVFAIGLAAFALGRSQFGQRAGLAFAAGIVLLPDAVLFIPDPFSGPAGHLLGLQNLVGKTPPSTYGLAVALLAVAIFLPGLQQRSLRSCYAGTILGAASLFFKAHVFLLAIPGCFILYLLLMIRSRDLWTSPAWLAPAALSVVASALLALVQMTPSIELEQDPGARYTQFLYSAARQEPLAADLAEWAIESNDDFRIVRRSVFILLYLFRLPLVVAAVLIAVKVLARDPWRTIDLLLLITLAILLTLSLAVAPNANGYDWDLQHVPAIWVMCLLQGWSLGTAASLVMRLPKGERILHPALLVLMIGILILTSTRPIHFDVSPVARWWHCPVEQGLIDAARYIREHASAGAIIQDSENDPFIIASAVAERPAYIGWHVTQNYPGRKGYQNLYEKRIANHDRLRNASTLDELTRVNESVNIEWYLLRPESTVAWPATFLSQPSFETDGYRVYRLPGS